MTKNIESKPCSETKKQAKEKRICQEVERLREQFSEIEGNKKNLVEATIQDAAFCTIEMEDLRAKLVKYGTTSYYLNGNTQFGEKQSPEAELYIKMSQRLDSAIKTLLSCMPKEQAQEQDDGFDEFIGKRG